MEIMSLTNWASTCAAGTLGERNDAANTRRESNPYGDENNIRGVQTSLYRVIAHLDAKEVEGRTASEHHLEELVEKQIVHAHLSKHGPGPDRKKADFINAGLAVVL